MLALADAHGTNSGDKQLANQQSALNATANSSDSARVLGVAQNFVRTSVWSADQCKVTRLSQRRELDTRVLFRILTLLEGNQRRGKMPAPDIGVTPPPVLGEPCGRSWILFCGQRSRRHAGRPRRLWRYFVGTLGLWKSPDVLEGTVIDFVTSLVAAAV